MGRDKGESTLRAYLIDVDTSEISGMYLYPTANDFKEIKFFKEGNNWKIDNDGSIIMADNNTLKSMMVELGGLRVVRLASNNKDKWAKYEVTDSLGTKVKIESDGKIVSTIILGKFDYNQETRVASNYVRIEGEDRVYVANGYASMSFNRDLASFRNRSLIETDISGWNRITYNYPGDSSFVLVMTDGYWMADGLATDSMATANYVSSLSRLGGSGFVDNADINLSQPQFSVVIEGANASPITIEAFADYSTEDFIIVSSENSEGKFSGLAGDLFSRIFVGKSKFAPRQLND